LLFEVLGLPKKRVYHLALELGLQTDELLKALAAMGVTGLTKGSQIDEETARAVQELLAEQAARARGATPAEAQAEAPAPAEAAAAAPPAATAATAPAPSPPAPEAEAEAAPPPPPAVAERAEREVEPERVLPRRASYFSEEMLVLERQLERLAQNLQRPQEAAPAKPSLRELVRRPSGPRPPTAISVPPVVTVLGHVDHGKTTLLDAIRQTNVTAAEAGGITQHIGASEVEYKGRPIVFLDTPGHEAFTQLRARGAEVTDIAVLVVAADDGVMPQTIEALNHARAAGVPIIVAINKIDLPDANPERVRQQLAEHGLIPEEWGGETVFVQVSALRKQGLDELLEMILLVAELQELWADPTAPFAGVVIEARLDSSRGPVATVLTRSGTLRQGDILVCGTAYGRVRQLTDWRGQVLKQVGPGRPVEIVGLSEVPEPGSLVEQAASLKEARRIAEQRREEEQARQHEELARRRVEEVYAELAEQRKKVLRAIIKADVWGSAEALRNALQRLAAASDELEADILHMGVGDVTESDVALAVAAQAVIIAFRVTAPAPVRKVAKDEHVSIRFYEIIYDALEDLRKELEGMLEPIYREERIGRAEVAQVFRSQAFEQVAGCRILEGRLQRGATIVVRRQREEVFRGTLDSLRHFDRNVEVLEAPNECGVGCQRFSGWQPGDVIEAYVITEIRPTLKVEPVEPRADAQA
jgi:translation initiation factor IF-2